MAETPLSPSYYKRGTAPVWDFIRDQGLNFHLGNAIKYICRAGYKGNKEEDLEKAIVYLQNELTHAKRQNLSRYDSPDKVVYGGSGLQGGLSTDTISFSSRSFEAAQPCNGGVQVIFGGGSDVISFGDSK